MDNKFTNCYFFMIEKIKSENRKRFKYSHNDYIYYELHHIVPKSLGGSNEKLNLVLLTAKEHLIAHWLLSKMCLNKDHHFKMLCAMNRLSNKDNHNLCFLANRYEEAKLERRKMLSEKFSGEGNPQYGKKWTKDRYDNHHSLKGRIFSDEEKQKIYGDRIGAKRTEATKNNISKNLKGKKKSAEHIKNMKKAITGRKLSQVHIDKIVKARKGKKKSAKSVAKYHQTIATQRANRKYKFAKNNEIYILNQQEALEQFNLKGSGINKAIRDGKPYKGFTISKIT